jgi:phage I-like protein
MRILVVDDDHGIAGRMAKVLCAAHLVEGVALNSSSEAFEVLALNYELAVGADAPPAELMLIPPGPRPAGRDGRAWNNRDPAGIVKFFQDRGLDIPFDIEHATELKAPKGEAAPAMAWVKSLQVRPDNSIWGTIEWTPKGSEMVMNREYRYYSPAIIHSKAMDIIGIKSVGLTNTPNFAFPALNTEAKQEETSMLKKFLLALSLPETTTEEAALNHITTLRTDHAIALNQAKNPSLDLFVPRAEYATALNRADAAEVKLKSIENATTEIAINSEIDAALSAGKITPATKEYYVAQCRQEGGLDRFKAFVKVAPAVAGDTGLDNKKLADGVALNAEEKAVCVAMGISEEAYIKANKA